MGGERFMEAGDSRYSPQSAQLSSPSPSAHSFRVAQTAGASATILLPHTSSAAESLSFIGSVR